MRTRDRTGRRMVETPLRRCGPRAASTDEGVPGPIPGQRIFLGKQNAGNYLRRALPVPLRLTKQGPAASRRATRPTDTPRGAYRSVPAEFATQESTRGTSA